MVGAVDHDDETIVVPSGAVGALLTARAVALARRERRFTPGGGSP